MLNSHKAMVTKIEDQLHRFAVTRQPKDFPSATAIMAAKRIGVRRRLDSMMDNLARKWRLA